MFGFDNKGRTNPNAKCPSCGKTLDAWAIEDNNQAPPKGGDFSMCAYCNAFMVFNDDLTLRLANEEETALIAKEVLRYHGSESN